MDDLLMFASKVDGVYQQPIGGGMMCPDPHNRSDYWSGQQNRPGHTLGQFNVGSCETCTLYYQKAGRSTDMFVKARELWEQDNNLTPEIVNAAKRDLMDWIK